MNRPDVVMLVRGAVIEQMHWASPEATELVLMHLATVPYDGDDDTYIAVAAEVIRAAAEKALRPTIDALRAQADASRARAEQLEAEFAQWQRDFEAFRRMKTQKTIH